MLVLLFSEISIHHFVEGSSSLISAKKILKYILIYKY